MAIGSLFDLRFDRRANATMNERVLDILERWEAETREGRTVTAEELCRDCEELVPEVRRRIQALAATAWLEKASSAPSAVEASEADILAHLPARFGRYEVRGLIGEGGFGYVLKGYDPDIRRDVAIKVLKPERLHQPDAEEAFLDEARHVAGLRHPGIVPVYDVGQQEGHCFIVSEYIEGQSLALYLNGFSPTATQAVRLVRDVARILGHAHDQGFVHRDVKPANILMEESENVFLTDFGIAICLYDAESAASSSAGTLAYMAPEQIAKGAVDKRSDIYSLGLVLFEMLYGHLPGDADDVSPRSTRTIPVDLHRIVDRCLAKDLSHRYASMSQLGQALESYGEDERWSLPWRKIGMSVILLAVVASAVTYLQANKSFGTAKESIAPANAIRSDRTTPSILDAKTQDFKPSPSDFGRVDGNTLSVGMGSRPDGVGFGAAGILLDKVSTLRVKVESQGIPRKYDRNSFLGFVVDFETSKGFTHRIALPFSFYSEGRWANCPDWGKAGVPNRVVDVGTKELYVIDLEQMAPADWSGRLWLTALCQNAGQGVKFDATVLKMTASTRPSPHAVSAGDLETLPDNSANANLGIDPDEVKESATDPWSRSLTAQQQFDQLRILVRWPGDTEILQVAITPDGTVENESDPVLSGVARVVEEGNIAIRLPHRTLLYSPAKQGAIWLSEQITFATAQPQQLALVEVLEWPPPVNLTGHEKLPSKVRLHWNDGL